jgi:hypothetical protein
MDIRNVFLTLGLPPYIWWLKMDLVATQLVMDIFLLPQVFYLQSYGNQKGFQLPFNNWAFLDGDQNPF